MSAADKLALFEQALLKLAHDAQQRAEAQQQANANRSTK